MIRSNILNIKKACCAIGVSGFFALALFATLLSSCDTVSKKGAATSGIMPNITGAAGEVLVVMDEFNWDNSAGDLMKDILKEEIAGLPQSEPLFDVLQITAAGFDGLYRFHRSIVMTTIDAGLEPKVRFRENIWAKPQIMVQIEAPTATALHQILKENDQRIQDFLVQYDRKRLIETYKQSKDPAIQKEIANHHQVRLAIPRGYNLDFSKDEYTSVSIEAPDLSQVIQVFDYPATGPEDLSTDKVIEMRNQITEEFVIGPREGSYMTISKLFKPIAYDLLMGDKKVVELRGLWELENGYMGGPFISHSIYDPARKRVVTVDGYLYHPNQKKRVKLKQLEAIVYSMELL